MKMPGFVADTSIYKTEDYYQSAGTYTGSSYRSAIRLASDGGNACRAGCEAAAVSLMGCMAACADAGRDLAPACAFSCVMNSCQPRCPA